MDSIPYRRWFPWLGISRAFSIALDPRNLLIALFGLVLMTSGHAAFRSFIPQDYSRNAVSISKPQAAGNSAEMNLSLERDADAFDVSWPRESLTGLMLQPFHRICKPAADIFFPAEGLRSTWADTATSWTLFFWNLFVWSLCGGAITRQAASQFARQKTLSLKESLGFSRKLFVSYFSAPLLPFVAIGALYLFNFAFGLLGLIPEIGPVIAGVLWFIPLIFSLLMAIVVACIAICWPLMYPVISVEGSDAFDGLSRSYSYLISKPWHLAGYVLFAVANGTIAFWIVRMMLMLTMYISIWSVTGSWGERESYFNTQFITNLLHESGTVNLLGSNQPVQVLIGLWIEGTHWLSDAFAYSYFWCAATIVYFVVRHSSDGTDLTQMYVPPIAPNEPATALKAVHTDVVPSVQADADTPPATESPT